MAQVAYSRTLVDEAWQRIKKARRRTFLRAARRLNIEVHTVVDGQIVDRYLEPEEIILIDEEIRRVADIMEKLHQ